MPFDNSRLRQHQLKLTEILKYFDSFCAENNIRYVLICGSALGAIRHSGFIPWDDDIDVGVPRPDYEKLEKLLSQHKNDLYTFEGADSHSFPHPPFAIFSRKKLMNSSGAKWPCIDIFPLEGVPTSALGKAIQKNISYVYHLAVYRNAPENRGAGFKVLSQIILKLTPNWAWDLTARFARRILSSWGYNTAKSVVNPYGFARYGKEIIANEVIGSCQRRISFEGLLIPVPDQCERYLTHFYGDYMTPPPFAKRCPPHQDFD